MSRIPSRGARWFFRVVALVAVLDGTMAYAADLELVRPQIVSAKTAGFGGAYSALETGFDTLSTNPAALAFVSSEWSVSRVAAHASGPLFDLPSVIQSDDLATGLLDLVAKNKGVYFGADVTGPLAFGKVDKNFGFGVFNRSVMSADVPSLTRANIYAGEEFLLTGGYGLTVFSKDAHSVAVGLQMKGFFQTFLYESGTSIAVLNAFTSFDVDTIPTSLSTGFGLDAGALYRFGDHLNVAVSCKDLYTPVFTSKYANYSDFLDGNAGISTGTDRLDPLLSAGVAFSLPLPEDWITVTDWKVMADYRDFLDLLKPIYRNPILNVALGTELVLLDVVSLRAGLNETYLSAGLGLDLSLFQIDFAMYGSELGVDPGKRPLLNMVLGVSFQY